MIFQDKAQASELSHALLTDMYQISMVYGYWREGWAERNAIFHLNFRRKPFGGSFAIAAGLAAAIEWMENFRFQSSDLEYLASLTGPGGKPLFEPDFFKFLSDFQFACDVDAVPEGTPVFPYEPILRVKGPIWQAQLLESPLLNLINFQTLIATKAARICLAAGSDPVIEFGMRRAQGPNGALSASRAAYIGGCAGTSNMMAAKQFGIPVRGTHAHSWIMAFDEEQEAFDAFAKHMPEGCVLLIDTYDSLHGLKKAIATGKKLRQRGGDLFAVRLDSGDLAQLSIEARKILDKEGFHQTAIMASNELDEYLIRDLKQQGAKITLWGVGTHLVTGKDQPALDGVYKLSAIQNKEKEWVDRIKLSEQMAKITNPGFLQIRRFFQDGYYAADVIYDQRTPIPSSFEVVDIFDSNQKRIFSSNLQSNELMVPIFRKGKLVYKSPSLVEIQNNTREELSKLPPGVKRFVNPQPYFAGLEKKLYEKKLAMIADLRNLK